MSSLCFTGHREFIGEENVSELKRFNDILCHILEKYITENDVDTFYAGGATGFDNYAADCVLKLKDNYPQIQLVEVLPFDRNNMSKNWSIKDRDLLLRLCKYANEVVEDPDSGYYKGCYRIRDQYMVDHADYCVAWYDQINRKRSGTGQTVRMAKKKKIPVENIFYVPEPNDGDKNDEEAILCNGYTTSNNTSCTTD